MCWRGLRSPKILSQAFKVVAGDGQGTSRHIGSFHSFNHAVLSSSPRIGKINSSRSNAFKHSYLGLKRGGREDLLQTWLFVSILIPLDNKSCLKWGPQNLRRELPNWKYWPVLTFVLRRWVDKLAAVEGDQRRLSTLKRRCVETLTPSLSTLWVGSTATLPFCRQRRRRRPTWRRRWLVSRRTSCRRRRRRPDRSCRQNRTVKRQKLGKRIDQKLEVKLFSC